jgi:hypothetical protein
MSYRASASVVKQSLNAGTCPGGACVIFRLSHKLFAKLKEGTLPALPLDANPFADWSANLFVAVRARYILLSNTRSLYSTVMFGKAAILICAGVSLQSEYESGRRISSRSQGDEI